jgi:hypothetical protein
MNRAFPPAQAVGESELAAIARTTVQKERPALTSCAAHSKPSLKPVWKCEQQLALEQDKAPFGFDLLKD